MTEVFSKLYSICCGYKEYVSSLEPWIHVVSLSTSIIMTSHPPGPCCLTGTLHTGSPKGSIEIIDDTRVYFSYPTGKDFSHGILLFPDANGVDLINTQLMADNFASQGYLVLAPDLLHDDPNKTKTLEELYEWLALHPTERVDPIVELTLLKMRELGCQSIAGVGYCFGAKYVIRNLRGLEGGLSAGFVAHPSFVTAEELGAIRRPLSIAAAGEKTHSMEIRSRRILTLVDSDYIFTTEKRRESEDILMKLDVPWQITLYSDVEHSFAVRGDLSKPRVKWAMEEAFGQAVRWFMEHLSNKTTID